MSSASTKDSQNGTTGEASVISLSTFRAHQLIEDGRFHISARDLDAAIDCFQRSIEWHETPEALTLLGWILSLRGLLNEAEDLCRRALILNPHFGQALNDLGGYLMQRGRLEDAIPLLQEAKKDNTYQMSHFPFINLGRIYSTLGRVDEAITEFEEALKLAPHHPEVIMVLKQLRDLRSPLN